MKVLSDLRRKRQLARQAKKWLEQNDGKPGWTGTVMNDGITYEVRALKYDDLLAIQSLPVEGMLHTVLARCVISPRQHLGVLNPQSQANLVQGIFSLSGLPLLMED